MAKDPLARAAEAQQALKVADTSDMTPTQLEEFRRQLAINDRMIAEARKLRREQAAFRRQLLQMTHRVEQTEARIRDLKGD